MTTELYADVDELISETLSYVDEYLATQPTCEFVEYAGTINTNLIVENEHNASDNDSELFDDEVEIKSTFYEQYISPYIPTSIGLIAASIGGYLFYKRRY